MYVSLLLFNQIEQFLVEMKDENQGIHLMLKWMSKIKLMQFHIEFELVYKYQLNIIIIMMLGKCLNMYSTSHTYHKKGKRKRKKKNEKSTNKKL